MANPDSILDSVKKVLGLEADFTAFDLDVTIFVNSSMGALQQLGVGPVEGVFVQDNTTLWAELTSEKLLLGLVQNYVYMKCRLAFDPSDSRFVLQAIQEQIKDLEWRINHAAETINPPGSPRHLQKHNPFGIEDSYSEIARELALDFNLER